METLICQNCGFILRTREFICNGCGTFLSDYSPTHLPALATANASLFVASGPDAEMLEKLVSKQQTGRFTTGASASRKPGSSESLFSSHQQKSKQHRDRQAEGATRAAELSGRQATKSVPPAIKGDVARPGKVIRLRPAAIAAVVMLCIGLAVVGSLGIFRHGTSAHTDDVRKQHGGAPMDSLDGTWKLTYRVGQQSYSGEMTLRQNGNQLTGDGQDTGYFVVNGSVDSTHQPPQVRLQKQYMEDGQQKESPILYTGEVQTAGDGLFMSGEYMIRKFKGNLLRVPFTVRDRWQAELAAGPAPAPGFPKIVDAFTRVAWLLLLLGFALAVVSLKLFGHNGLINIWTKNKYIPSQFAAQHARRIQALGKPVRPGGVPLGSREDWNLLQFNMPKHLALTPELREANPHILLLGGGAKGKTRLMAGMIAHDIESNDRAVVIMDSGGGLIDLITRWVASHRNARELSQRIVVIDPTSTTGCPAYNPLEEPADGDMQATASAIVFGFKALYTEAPGSQSQWSQQTANILRHSALLLMANGRTLTDLPSLLSDNDFRDVLLDKVEKRKDERVEYITLLETWGQYKRLARTDQWITWVEPILNRISPMLSDPRIRPILTKAHGDLNLQKVISERKILLVKIPQGQLENANLLGSLIVSGLKRAALSLTGQSAHKHPCSLYLDEFDSFIEKETLRSLTKETSTFQIGLVGAMRTLQHLPEDFRSELTVNFGTMCIFALAKKDGELLGPQMFRVDGRKVKNWMLSNLINRVNSSPQYELISDEEKLNIDRVVGQEERTYFCYQVGTVAGVFRMKAPEFKDIPDAEVNWAVMNELRTGRPTSHR